MALPVKVTEVPAQIAPEGLAVIPILTGRFGFTLIAMELEIAGLPVAQMALDVNMQLIISPFEGT